MTEAGSVTAENRVGVVAIGRDEGGRLERCLRSVAGLGRPLVYVDSGSRDGSVAFAREIGAHVVELEPSVPFTMARARNHGFAALCEREAGLSFVQFIDGDCEMERDFIETARAYLEANPGVAAVTGFRRERAPEASVWNRLADLEWRGPVGRIDASGGDVMIRCEVLEALGGFREEMIAGEEPELCARMRLAGHEIHRLDAPMTLHDADMHRFDQWWRRTKRGGHACAEGADLQGRTIVQHNVRALRSTLAWGLALPLATLVAAALAGLWGGAGWVALVFAAFIGLHGLQTWRVARGESGRGDEPSHDWLYAASCVAGKFPQALGALQYWRTRGRERTLIEYKGPAAG